MEIFMDHFSMFGYSFDNYLHNLSLVFQRCQDTNLVLNLEKCHFMVQSGIVLGHRVYSERVEVDQAKITGIESFLLQRMLRVSEAFSGLLISTDGS